MSRMLSRHAEIFSRHARHRSAQRWIIRDGCRGKCREGQISKRVVVIRHLARVGEIGCREHAGNARAQFPGDTVFQCGVESAIREEPIENQGPASVIHPRARRFASGSDMFGAHVGQGAVGKFLFAGNKPRECPALHVLGGPATASVARLQQGQPGERVAVSDKQPRSKNCGLRLDRPGRGKSGGDHSGDEVSAPHASGPGCSIRPLGTFSVHTVSESARKPEKTKEGKRNLAPEACKLVTLRELPTKSWHY